MTTVPSMITGWFASNLSVIHMHVDDLTQEETVLNPAQGGNNIAWTLGHIAHFRQVTLENAGIAVPWPAERYARFGNGSAPLDDPAEAAHLPTLLADIDSSQALLADWLANASEEQLAFKRDGARRDLGGQIGWYGWHEAYHVGQLETLRHSVGRHEKLI